MIVAGAFLLIPVALAAEEPEPHAQSEEMTDDADRDALDVESRNAQHFTIDLTTALQLATSVNPRIGVAHAGVEEALALDLGARSLLLPTLAAGTNYHLHAGKLQTSFGQIRTLNEQSIYFGGGARTLAAETVAIPAVRIFAQLGDAVYAPLAARQVVAERNATAVSETNLTLLDVARQYLMLIQAETRREALQLTMTQVNEAVRVTKTFAEAGQGRFADYHRARTRGLLLRMELEAADVEAAEASSELARLLRLDQTVELQTPSAPLELIVLTPIDADLNYLVDVALSRRPDLIARNSAIAAADARVRQEIMRPWLPTISVGFSAGGFGGGSDRQDLGVSSFFQRLGTRTDFDVFAVWQAQNMGHGNRSWQQIRAAERDEAVFVRSRKINEVRRDVAEAYANLQAARRTLAVAQLQLKAAETAAEEDLKRTRAGEGLPIEVLNSLNLLARSRLELIDAATAFNLAQFELFVAMGENPLSRR